MAFDKMGAQSCALRPSPGRRAHGEVLVARRYVTQGFLDAAMRIFARNVQHVETDDWALLVERLLDRGRIAEAVHVCQLADIPLPREALLAHGDRNLRRNDVDGAIHCYELAEADQDRWSGLVDVLIRLPGRELHAVNVAQRHLVSGSAALESPAPNLV
jgi:hypothetical protein